MSTTDNECDPVSSNSKLILGIDAYPFKGLKISEDWKELDSVDSRTICSLCKKSRKYFCYTCYVAVPELRHIVPKVKLPVKIDIIKHAREMDGKSTAVHMAVLAPNDVRIFTYPCIPDYDPHENVVLIFPNKEAVSVEEVCQQFFSKIRSPSSKRACHGTGSCVVHRAVFIDSTWNQSRGIFKDPRIKVLPSVVLKSRLSQFWRHQADSPRWYLATVEAAHQFLVELEAAQWHLEHGTTTCKGSDPSSDSSNEPCNLSDGETNCRTNENETSDINKEQEYTYNGQYDNLLFFFRFMYSKIHSLYDHDQLRSYKRRLE